jgi:hypothetical protein
MHQSIAELRVTNEFYFFYDFSAPHPSNQWGMLRSCLRLIKSCTLPCEQFEPLHPVRYCLRVSNQSR